MSAAQASGAVPTIAHVVYRFDIGGLENGIVNLLNRMPADRYRHAIVCLTGYSDFAARIQRDDVRFVALDKKPGKDPGCYLRFARTLRRLKPDIVHTRNLGTLDMQAVAAFARIRGRIHGEHGWDVHDLHGDDARYLRLRRICRHFVHRYVAVSSDLTRWLQERVGVPRERISHICNGVDSEKFRPREAGSPAPWPPGFAPPGAVVVGTVGRMEPVKNPLGLLRAFQRLLDVVPAETPPLRLIFIGGGPLFRDVEEAVKAAGLSHLVWLAGPRNDVAELLRHLDVFALPSLNEGISNTILEAMASGVPVVAGRIGGNPELIREGETGTMYPVADEGALCEALRRYCEDARLRQEHGARARAVIERSYGLDAMVRSYVAVYDELLKKRH